LLRSEVFIGARKTFSQGDVFAAAIAFQGIDGPGAKAWHVVVFCPGHHCPEGSVENEKEGAEKQSGAMTSREVLCEKLYIAAWTYFGMFCVPLC
jgi:hypothetical protein